jgi:hypothetical protein
MTQKPGLLLTLEQVQELTEEQAEKHLKRLEKHYHVDTPFGKLDNFLELWLQIDEITNTMLYLEDHISRQQMLERVSNAGSQRWSKAQA